ncbi:MAG: alpha-L-fucosidase [Chloroflexi bacterium]|nr:alpha-L-fucosidase [Chloroflexota bacterium]
MNNPQPKITRYEPTWESLKQYSAPQWYMDAKFGIFIHWGVYCVPAFGNEWYPRNMYIQGSPEFEHHLKTYGPQDKFGYKDFIPMFKAEKFDPAAWATLFRKAGARYVMPVAEHHDGFAMYDCSLSRWNSVKMGPKRDIVGELAAAVRKEGMVFGLSSHRAEHWFFMNGGRFFDSDVQDPQYEDFYGPACAYPAAQDSDAWRSLDWNPRPHAKHLEDWLARTCELVDKYQPQVVWFDWWIEQIVFQPYLQRFAAYYYNRGLEWGKGVAINYKNKPFPMEAAVYDIERGQLSGINPHFWQTDTSISKNSWGYVSQQDYKTAESLVGDLVDIVSKNGTLLLNIGPRPDGTIPEEEEKILLDIGEWLAVNGEAIYGTRPWKVYGEGPTAIPEGGFTDTQRAAFTGNDFRFTTKDGALYAIALAWPGKAAKITSLGSGAARVSGVSLLGSPEQLNWSQDESGLKISLPAEKPCQYAYSFKVT